MSEGAPYSQPLASLWRTLGWSAYLGCSWTWCIGMFLPILLMRDFGAWGFVVFAIPNVIGAAAMGWVLRSREDAESILDTHRWAVRAFSWITIAFHCYWLGWMVRVTGASGGFPPIEQSRVIYPLVLVGAIATLACLIGRRHLLGAGLLWLLSLALGLYAINHGAWDDLCRENSRALSLDAPPSLFALAPVCVFGFLFCPYLDATFLHARRSTSAGEARAAFGVGFGVVFFSMILLTFAYSATLAPAIRNPVLSEAIRAALLPHFFLQSIFTIVVHARALPHQGASKRAPQALLVVPCIALLGAGALVEDRLYSNLAAGEVIYRGFMAFYGLVFPAYVWICMLPTRDGHWGLLGPRGRRKLRALCFAIGVAIPFYWMGFIERQTWLLAPGLAIVLVSRLFVMGSRKLDPGEPGDVLRGGV